jgi:hypothetical protein
VNNEHFSSAARRHIDDAERLLDLSEDQAWHLAGFAHECARKACVEGSWVAKVLSHDFTNATEHVVAIAEALEPRRTRLPVARWTEAYPSVANWRPEVRYEKTGTAVREKRDVAALVREGRAAVEAAAVARFFMGERDLW